MSPVSFEVVGTPGDRDALLAQARLLSEAGVRIHSMEPDRGLLVRSDQAGRARAVLDGIEPDEPAAPTGTRLVAPLERPVDARVEIPGSKSHTNRALLCAGLARGRSRLSRVLFADDTEAMMGALIALGVTVEADTGSATVEIGGGPGSGLAPVTGEDRLTEDRLTEDRLTEDRLTEDRLTEDRLTVEVNQSGTTGRFLVPVLASIAGRFVLDGHPQLRARPFGPQLAALRQLGARIEGDRLPLVIDGRQLAGGSIEVSADLSSQFLSGLLLAAPLHAAPSTLTVDGAMVSRPYVELTTATMARFGVEVAVGFDVGFEAGAGASGRVSFAVPAGGYRPADVELEPDASGASYFFAAAAITGGRVRVDGLGTGTVQGDLAFVDLLHRMGAEVEIGPSWTEVRGTGRLQGIDADLADVSDTAQTLAVVASFAEGPSTLSGIGFIRHKETDRIAATVAELRRRGIEAAETDDGMVIHPGPARPGVVRTYDDHRMAMSFALLGLVHPGIEIESPECVAKTFPDFFERLDALRRPV